MREQKHNRQIQSNEEETEQRQGTYWSPPPFSVCANPEDGSNKPKGKGIWEDTGKLSVSGKIPTSTLKPFNTPAQNHLPKPDDVEENSGIKILGGSYEKEKEDGIYAFQKENLSIEADGHAKLSKNGINAEANAKFSASLVEFQKTLKLDPIPFDVLGESTLITGLLRFSGMIGVEANAHLEANIGKMTKTKNPLNLSKENVKAGFGGEADVFAGGKLTVNAQGNYAWYKRSPDFYLQKISKNYTAILSVIKKINPSLGGLLDKIDSDKIIETICKFLFSDPGLKPLVDVEAEASGMVGAAAQAKGGVKLEGGKLMVSGKAGISFGLGLGGEATLAFDLIEGILFGLVIGGELLQNVVQFMDKIFPMDKLFSLGSHIKEWINEKRDPKSEKTPLKHKNPYPMHGAKPAFPRNLT